MAKKKAAPAVGIKASNLSIRVSDAYRQWLEKAAEHSRMSVSNFVDFAAVAYAKQQGFKEEPPKR